MVDNDIAGVTFDPPFGFKATEGIYTPLKVVLDTRPARLASGEPQSVSIEVQEH